MFIYVFNYMKYILLSVLLKRRFDCFANINPTLLNYHIIFIIIGESYISNFRRFKNTKLFGK